VETWLEKITSYAPDILLLKPSGKTSLFRTSYQERLEILVDVLNYQSFPSLNEVRIYENKRYFAYWAKANNLPHPDTFIFYNKNEALSAINSMNLPLVGKMNIGASGNGVQILHTKDGVKNYIDQAFSTGLISRIGPRFRKGKLIQRAWRKLTHPKELVNRLKTYQEISSDVQKGFVILQKYIKHEYEWRVVRIGESYFAHKKLVAEDMASGTLLKKYDDPSPSLLEFVRFVTDRFGFRSMAVDLFEPEPGHYLINEMQCIFGQSDPYQMLVDGKPGRYVFTDGRWVFEAGDFNTHESFDLRVQAAIDLYGIKD
jgi:hypothetical protein